MQANARKPRSLNGRVSQEPLVDLIIFDCQENLPIPLIFEKHVPSWNSNPSCAGMQNSFHFAEESLQDNGYVLVFHSYSLGPSITAYVCGTEERLQEVGDEEGVVGIQPIGPSIGYYTWSNDKFF